MNEELEPALTAEEWAKRLHGSESDNADSEIYFLNERRGQMSGAPYLSHELVTEAPMDCCIRGRPPAVRDCAAFVALANHALPDSDPRKLTWAHMDALNDFTGALMTVREGTPSTVARKLLSLASILASYMPPRGI